MPLTPLPFFAGGNVSFLGGVAAATCGCMAVCVAVSGSRAGGRLLVKVLSCCIGGNAEAPAALLPAGAVTIDEFPGGLLCGSGAAGCTVVVLLAGISI